MPSVNDWSKEDEDAGGLSEGFTPAQSSAIGSATNGPKQAQAPTQQQDSFVPWSSFVSANQDVSNREAGKLQSQVQGDVSAAQKQLGDAAKGYDSSIDSNYSNGNKKPFSPMVETAPFQSVGFAADPNFKPSVETARNVVQPGNVSVAPTANGPAVRPAAPATTNLWEGFLGPSAQRGSLGGAQASQVAQGALPQASRDAQHDLGRGYLTDNARDKGPGGASDLESSLGPAAWSQLTGATTRAQNEANALGSESGVQSLLQAKESSPGNSAFDAALINGAGGPGFRQLSQQYGGNKLADAQAQAEQRSQGEWARLQGDVGLAQGERDRAAQAASDKTAADTATDAMAAKARADAAANPPAGPAPITMGALPGVGGGSTTLGGDADTIGSLNSSSTSAPGDRQGDVLGDMTPDELDHWNSLTGKEKDAYLAQMEQKYKTHHGAKGF